MGRLKRRLIRWLRRCLQRVLDWLPTDYEPVWTPLSPELEKALKQIIDHDPYVALFVEDKRIKITNTHEPVRPTSE